MKRALMVCLTLVFVLAACGPVDDNNASNNTAANNTAENNTAENNTTANNTPANNTTANNTPGNNTTANNTPGNNTTANNTTAVSFANDIAPLVLSTCNVQGCHASPGQGNHEIDGDDAAAVQEAWEDVEASSSDLKLIEPGQPENSEIYVRVANLSNRAQMPLGDMLTADQIEMIETWIANGANYEN